MGDWCDTVWGMVNDLRYAEGELLVQKLQHAHFFLAVKSIFNEYARLESGYGLFGIRPGCKIPQVLETGWKAV